MVDPRHISYLYSKVIFNDNINQVVNYINQQSLVLENQRINNCLEIKQLVLLGQCFYELKTVEGFIKSMEYFKEAMDIMSNSTQFSTKQVDYSFLLASHACSYHAHEYYMDGKKQISRFNRSLREPKDVYDQIEAALTILNEIQYTGPQIGVIINMYLNCVFSCGKTAWSMQYETAEIEYLKALATQGLVNLKNNGLPDVNADVADSYCMLGCVNVFFKDKKLAKGYFLKAIELYSQIYNASSHPKIAIAYSRILTTCLDHRDQNLGIKAIAMKRAYYGHMHFEVIDPLYSTYVCLLKNNCYNITVESDLNSTQKANGVKTINEQIFGGSGCCTIL